MSKGSSYNAVGNRTASHLSTTYTHAPFNRLTATQTASYGFDANGNTTTKSEGSNFWRYGWDHENRLVTAGTRKQSVRNKYDALGRRIERNLGTGRERTKFTYDGDDVLLDDNKGTLTKYQNGLGIDNKLSAKTGSTINYLLSDHLGSTNGLIDSSGSVTASTSYDSFGNASNSTFPSRYQFTGREADSFTGLHYYRARFYDSKLGRFISEDPIGLAGGINQFSYVSNNPIAKTDPLGLFEDDVHFDLAYYLAMRSGCFSSAEAMAIANNNNGTDYDPETAPGWMRFYRNSKYHALTTGQFPGKGSPDLWNGGINYVSFGRYLHHLQDTFSHDSFNSEEWGHSRRGHYPDKTNSDPEKAMRMAEATWAAMRAFARQKGCACSGVMDPTTRQAVDDFNRLPGSNFGLLNSISSTGDLLDFGITNPAVYRNRKRAALGLY